MTPPARVCVVVSAYDRSWLLPDLVAALKAQTLEDFEAILVDNGSTDDTHAVLVELTAGDPRFRVLRVEVNRGPARARNLGWRATDARWVAFTDDDCAPTPTWLEELLDAGRIADIVQGRTIPAERPPGERGGWFDRSQSIVRWSGRYETCNLLVARAVLDLHGGFTEDFHIAMGEDTDLGLRAVAAGATQTFADRAVVVHCIWPTGFRAYLHQRRRYAESVQLMRLNPAARQLLRGGYVLRGVHILVWAMVPVSVASVALGAGWIPLGVIAAWVVRNTHRTRYRPFPVAQRLWYSVLHLLAYAYETACFAIASARYRALVI